MIQLLESRLTVPDHHLFRSGDTLGRVIATVHGGLGLAQFLGRGATSDFAAMILHIHVRLAAFMSCQSWFV